jgi:phage terminase large subunit-like protein
LPHIKGRWKTPTIELEPWQCFFLTVIFGWVDGDGLRRYRKAYIEVPRKNAKTTISAGIALYLLCADGEPGAEVYSAAVTRDQAKYSWDIAQQMVKRDVEMQEYYGLEPLAHSIVIPRLGASFKPLSRDADLHAHKTREVFDVINLATGSRHQSLVVQITTAGDNKTGVCYEQHHYIEQTLQGNHEDERYFGIIYTIDPEDDWTTAEAARKANPNYGVSVLRDDIETKRSCRPNPKTLFSPNGSTSGCQSGQRISTCWPGIKDARTGRLNSRTSKGIRVGFTLI